MKVIEVKRLIQAGKDQLDYLARKLDTMEYYSTQDEYSLNTSFIADVFVQMLYDDENDSCE